MKIRDIICEQIIKIGKEQLECCSRLGIYQDDVRNLKKKRQELVAKKMMQKKAWYEIHHQTYHSLSQMNKNYEIVDFNIDGRWNKNEGCSSILIRIFGYYRITIMFRQKVLQLLFSTLFIMLQSCVVLFVKEWLIQNCLSETRWRTCHKDHPKWKCQSSVCILQPAWSLENRSIISWELCEMQSSFLFIPRTCHFNTLDIYI